MEAMVVDESNGASSRRPVHTHDTDDRLATCMACRLEEARADLKRAQQRLRRLRDADASGGDSARG